MNRDIRGREIVESIALQIESINKNDRIFEAIDPELKNNLVMELELKRIAKKTEYTIGHLYIDGIFFTDTLEDPHRADGIKIQDETCIPEGRYKVIINESARFKCRMPLLLSVPNFTGIRIHSGNKATDTSGCILVGENKVVGKLINSKVAFDNLFDILDHAPDDIFITIT